MKICTLQDAAVCEDCPIQGELMCRFERSDLLNFFLHFLPFGIAAAAGMVRAGFGWYLFGMLGYMIFFFFIWEARILCSHCPYWAEEGRVLHCPANYGVIKIWKFNPAPMNRSEQIQFLVGALLLILYPFPFMLLGGQYLLALIALASAGVFTYNLIRSTCSRCINFSCPLNRVPAETVDAWLQRNPDMLAAWGKNSCVAGGKRK